MNTADNLDSKPIHRKSVAWERLSQTQKWAGGADFPIMFHLGRVSHRISQAVEEEIGLSVPQMRILFGAADPEGISQAMLHKQYRIDPASITRTVQAMERDGLITRSPDPDDNRIIRVHITEKGRAITEALPERLAAFEQKLVAGLEQAEVRLMHELLERLEGGLGALK